MELRTAELVGSSEMAAAPNVGVLVGGVIDLV